MELNQTQAAESLMALLVAYRRGANGEVGWMDDPGLIQARERLRSAPRRFPPYWIAPENAEGWSMPDLLGRVRDEIEGALWLAKVAPPIPEQHL